MSKKADYERGRVLKVPLQRTFVFNGNDIKTAMIEIDHINYGLNAKTKGLNKKKRTNFKASDVERFLILLDGENIAARDYRGKISRFEVRIDCPVPGKFLGKEFIMIFDTNYDTPNQIHTVTLYPGW